MVIGKDNPVGIDVLVAYLQKGINSKLSWANLIDIYPRCYVVYREDNVTIEHYYANGNYDSVNNAEGNKCFFVLVGNPQKENNQYYSAQLDVYFTLNLKEINPDINYRCDEEVRVDILKVIEAFNVSSNVVNVDEVVIGIDNVYRGVYFNPDDDNQPYHCFKITLNVQYDINGHFCSN